MDGIQRRGHWAAALRLYLTLSAFSGWLAAPQHQVLDAMRGNKGECLSPGMHRCVLGGPERGLLALRMEGQVTLAPARQLVQA